MNWFMNLFGRGALNNPDEGKQSSTPGGSISDAQIEVSDQRAMMISAVFGCVRLLVQTGATLPLGFYEKTANGREAMDDDYYLCQLLKYSPNSLMTAKEFRMALWAQRVMWGNGYAEIRRSNSGRPIALLPLKPANMQVEKVGDRLIYEYNTNSGKKVFDQKDIFHLKGFSVDGIMGLSPLGHARHTLGITVSADRHASRSFSGKPSGVLQTDDILKEGQREQLRSIYGGIEKSAAYKGDGGLMLLEGGFKYQEVGLHPDDLQMLESRQFQVPEICRFFGVPAVMIDGSAGAQAAWPASYEQQVLSFLTFTLKPYLEEWEDKTSASLMETSERRKRYMEHKVDGLLRTDSKSRSEYYSSMVQNGLMTRNEARAKENMPRVEGADELTAQLNLTPVDQLAGATNVSK